MIENNAARSASTTARALGLTPWKENGIVKCATHNPTFTTPKVRQTRHQIIHRLTILS